LNDTCGVYNNSYPELAPSLVRHETTPVICSHNENTHDTLHTPRKPPCLFHSHF